MRKYRQQQRINKSSVIETRYHMEWAQLSLFFVGVMGLFIWNRTESRSDWRHCDAQITAIREEMKDFHTTLALQDQEFKMRLCAIEERNRK